MPTIKSRSIKAVKFKQFRGPNWKLYHGDCVQVMATLPENSVHAIICDPPYNLSSITKRFGNVKKSANTKTSKRLRNRSDSYARVATGFAGMKWDHDIAFKKTTWQAAFRVLRPGGYLLACGGCRTIHRMICAIEDAGFVIQNQFAWLQFQGMPKSHDISKAIDKKLGKKRKVIGLSNRHPSNNTVGPVGTFATYKSDIGKHVTAAASKQSKHWDGYGTDLAPNWEPIVIAFKPRDGTIANNVLKWGCGGINIDAGRLPITEKNRILKHSKRRNSTIWNYNKHTGYTQQMYDSGGRWPGNVAWDGAPEIQSILDKQAGGEHVGFSGGGRREGLNPKAGAIEQLKTVHGGPRTIEPYQDTGSIVRFMYCTKANRHDRADSKHATVKPLKLMQHLCKIYVPHDGVVLDPFAGSGTTLAAAVRVGKHAIGIEKEPSYIKDIRHRMAGVTPPIFAAVPIAAKPSGKIRQQH